MSGRPIRRRVLAAIQRSGDWAPALDGIESGETVTEIPRSFNLSRSLFARRLHEHRARHEPVCQARKVAPDAPHESGVNPTRDDVQRPNLRADLRVWLASKVDREQYTEIGPLHIEVMRYAAKSMGISRAELRPTDEPNRVE